MKKAFLLLILLLLLLSAAGHLGPAGPAATADPFFWAAPSPGLSPSLSALDGYPRLTLGEQAQGEPVVEILIVGDVSLGRLADGQRITAPAGALEQAGWLHAADLTLGNLESPLVSPSLPPVSAGPYILWGPPEAAAALKQAGFDLLGLANNHTLDFGPAGLDQTRRHLEQAGLLPLGSEPVYQQVHGLRLAFLAFNRVGGSGAAPVLPQETMVAAVAAAAQQAHAVVVLLHWGQEYRLQAEPAQERLADALLAAGASLLVGHHPHVVQPVRIAGQGATAYSLGNFLFDQSTDQTGQGLALRARFGKQGLLEVQLLPVAAGWQPHLLTVAEAETLWERVLPERPRLEFSCSQYNCHPIEAPIAGQNAGNGGLFWSGQIDLTGDGRPEGIRREKERVFIYEQGKKVWESPPEWRVADLALGDPNDDGRAEIMLAVWKREPAGYERSHPYLVGYRNGGYRLLWGGRAVVAPLNELEVADVTGDGVPELLVLEETVDGQRAVAVWQWHGWGFSLLWRTPTGPYEDLRLHTDSWSVRCAGWTADCVSRP